MSNHYPYETLPVGSLLVGRWTGRRPTGKLPGSRLLLSASAHPLASAAAHKFNRVSKQLI